MTYYITYKVDGRYEAQVEAETLDEAFEIAETEFTECDIGDLMDVEGKPIIVEDENGQYVWEY